MNSSEPIATAMTTKFLQRLAFGLVCAISISALFVCEGGAMLLFRKKMPSYPSGWPLCHSVYHRLADEFEVNWIALAVNLLVCGIMITALVYTTRRVLAIDLRKPRMTIRGILISMIVVALMCIWYLYEQPIGDWLFVGIGIYRPLYNHNSILTHWRLTLPIVELSLRAILLLLAGLYACDPGLPLGRLVRQDS